VIPVRREPLPGNLVKRLTNKTASLQHTMQQLATASQKERTDVARASWNNGDGSRAALTEILNRMAPGRQCCMYCSDGQGTSVDHYEPINVAPGKTWDWDNHILACSICNSSNKRGQFPKNAIGEPLFLNPTVDDPFDHLVLAPSTGTYMGSTDRGTFTADQLLNRELLERGRQAAWHDALDHIRAYARAVQANDADQCRLRQFRLTQRPNLDAFYSVLRYAASPTASVLVPSDVVGHILNHKVEFLAWLGL
jgi:5-methylcytosine-specific restriction endonuclease McrA